MAGREIKKSFSEEPINVAKNNPTPRMTTRMIISASIFGTPLRCSQNNGGVQMTAMNTAIKKGTRMELAAFIPATTMIKPARVNTVGTLKVRFPFLSIGFRSSNYEESVKNHERVMASKRKQSGYL